MELIQELSEDKKLTAFMEKRYKEYERDVSCSETVQIPYKDEIEVSAFIFENQPSMIVLYIIILYSK